MMEISGWGRYPRIAAEVWRPYSIEQITHSLRSKGTQIARGLGRSYGDSALASRVSEIHYLDHFIEFDAHTGFLSCAAGVSLDTILQVFVPRGWFLPVTPGTRFVTIGGAIASDVHGKNHHKEGTFSQHVSHIDMLLGNGERVGASRTENPLLFKATCGGMGLTGIILAATLKLKPIRSSEIIQTTIKAPNLDRIHEEFEMHSGASYSVAWIDCLARGKQLGRSLLMLGEHAVDGELRAPIPPQLPMPFDLPPFILNRSSVKTFNAFYYNQMRHTHTMHRVSYYSFFYPLDRITDWNRLYGRPGFLQYQFVLPKQDGLRGLRTVLETIAQTGRGSFLAVLKAFGPSNPNYLSFPQEGYTLALDFKTGPSVFKLLDTLDRIVLDHGGRLYLAKDARMKEATFKASYPHWRTFEEIRARYHALGKFASLQSQRLGLQ
jgi:FAD/FMN-containing dehydrogenase